MLNRRDFVRAAAGTAMFTRITGAFPSAASYDLIVRGGRVIDPSIRIDAVHAAVPERHGARRQTDFTRMRDGLRACQRQESTT